MTSCLFFSQSARISSKISSLRVPGESPPLLLLAVIAPAVAATLDYAAARPHAHAWAPAALLLAGLALYAAKLPERLCAAAAGGGSAPAAGGRMRLIDFAGHSHMLHHLCYSAALAIMAAGYAAALAREACDAPAAAGDARCDALQPWL